MTKGTEQEWTALQTAYRTAHGKREDFSSARRLKYGDGSQAYYSAGERKAYDVLCRAESRTMDRIMKWLDRHSPRNWHSMVPAHWICGELNHGDAVTAGILWTVPPPAYGYSQQQAECFAAGTQSNDYRRAVQA